jgi:hypothetical protein
MPDFSVHAKAEVLKFRIDDDIFEAFAAVGGGLLLDVSGNAPNLEIPDGATAEQMAEVAERARVYHQSCFKFVQDALLPSSRERFAERLRSGENPITFRQVSAVYRWLIEQYSVRPTTPPSSSSPGPGGTGTSSTDTAPIVDLTPDSSTLPGSLT